MRVTKKEALRLLKKVPLLDLGKRADSIRKELHPDGTVTFIVDRNINYTNVCINRCRFCAFYRDIDSPEAYVLTKRLLFRKIKETIEQGGTQILIQGGLHPELDIFFYIDLLKSIKKRFDIDVHGFSPPEITYIAAKSDLTVRETLRVLRNAGLDSIPGGGAEILSDRVREQLSPKKIRSSQWLRVMEEAHRLGMRTTATMMFGSIEGEEDIVEHLDAIRGLQDRTGGFTAFIPWSFQPGNTELGVGEQGLRIRGRKQSMNTKSPFTNPVFAATGVDYLRVLAVSRVYLDNIPNIQASWVTQGVKTAQVALRFGANDFGSTMIEENVVKAAGVSYRVAKQDIIEAIKSAGFMPAQRDTVYNTLRYF
ncbi:aminodeoxyfutalosine synthase [bacterium BMS3Abin07]|nr:aminodeoxyfutalosine synthase [bacterium BMS3Abin07]GBE31936.1 aminodeoxyfutalosine synthase [bacterium BMS3Bbin05]HDL20571.1 dehypoxanthine futalosine cyclase [Nitrospirota bacterium]HDO23064.1 dehypoxanthine futalosine cyclase [Nitrospirota bacterium]HDZ88786.1 dehypoxanthine futalosine cyclase [Nitrospirota bacterium]